MFVHLRSLVRLLILVIALTVLIGEPRVAAEKPTAAITQGQRVYSIGHSFHVFMPRILSDVAQAAGIKDHTQVGLSSIGGSRVIQHWEVGDDRFKSKQSLRYGKVDVLTMAPIFLPDDGIEYFAALALENNPDIRITIQEFWLPFDWYAPSTVKRPEKVDHDEVTISELRKRHAPYFEAMDDHVRQLNKQFGKTALYVVPVGQAVLALREKILEGQAPGLKKQSELFTDAIGHATPPLQALVAYCHFAVTYRRSPVGLPAPEVLTRGKGPMADPALVKLLQELAWQAATQHPLSGVKAE